MMADNYKILAQDTASSIEENSGETQANILYTVPENTQASISSISLINTAEENVEYSLGVIKAEDVESSANIESTSSINIINSQAFVMATGFGSSSLLLYSEDGITWTQTSLPIAPESSGIVFGDNKFIQVSRFSSSVSSNGLDWQLGGSLPNSLYYTEVAFGNGTFVTIPTSDFATLALYSSDGGASWNSSPLPISPNNGIAFGDNKFVVVAGGGSSAYSADGITWTVSQMPSSSNWKSIAYGDGKFVVAGGFNSAAAAYSTDGISWISTGMPYASDWDSIAYGNGKFVAVSYLGGLAYSDDGINWSAANYLDSPSSRWSSVAYGNGKFVAALDLSSNFAYSEDGVSWTLGALPADARWGVVAYGEFVNEETVTTTSTTYTLSSSQTIIPTRSIEPNVVDEIVGGITLSAGDQIRVYSESPDLIAQVYGVEIV
jgi:hypothetical protein